MSAEWRRQSEFRDQTFNGNFEAAGKIVDEGVTKETIGSWRAKYGSFPGFSEAAEKALKTTSKGEQVFLGKATAVMVDRDGNLVAFWSNNDDSSSCEVFARAALEKATARAVLYKGKSTKKVGLFRERDGLTSKKFRRHEGASTQPVMIDNKRYFIGVSGAFVNENVNRRVLGKEFGATGEASEWRAAGYWDRFCANRIRAFFRNEFAPAEVGPIRIKSVQASSNFMD